MTSSEAVTVASNIPVQSAAAMAAASAKAKAAAAAKAAADAKAAAAAKAKAEAKAQADAKAKADAKAAADAKAKADAEAKATKAAEDAKTEFFTKFKTSSAFFASVPELSDLLTQAFKEGWTADKLGQAYQDTQWFNSHLPDQRDYAVAKATDKGAYAEQYNNLLGLMKRTAQGLGIDISSFGDTITPDQVGAIQDSANPVAEFLAQHYNTPASADLLQNYISQHGIISGLPKTPVAATGPVTGLGVTGGTGGLGATGGTGGFGATGGTGPILGGTIADNVNALKSYASSMGVASQYLSPTWGGGTAAPGSDYFTNAAQSILSGTSNIQKEQEYIKNQAMAMYAPFAKRIAEGQTVAALASPYTTAISNLLEVGQNSIDLGAPTGYGAMVTKAMQGDGTNPVNLDQFTTQIKQKPEWLQTTNARNSLMDTATQLLRNFGMVVGG